MKRPASQIAPPISPDSVLVVDVQAAQDPSEERSEEETALLALIDGQRTVSQILHLSRMSGFVVMRRLRGLLERQIIRPLPTAETSGNGGSRSPRGARMGLTQDLTAAANSLVAAAQSRPRAEAPVAVPATYASLPGMTTSPQQPQAPPAAAPADAASALPTVIVAFQPEPPESSRRTSTKKLTNVEVPEIVPPGTRPATSTAARPPADPDLARMPVGETALVETRPSGRLLASRRETAVIPRDRDVARRRRRATPPTIAEVKAQELWVALTRKSWSTLAVVPTQSGGSALTLANALAEAGTALRGKPVELFYADGAELRPGGSSLVDGVSGDRIDAQPVPDDGLPPAHERFNRVIALEPLTSNPRGMMLAQLAEAVLMVAEKGVTEISNARRTVGLIGNNRLVGCVMLSRPADEP
jgi:hypothetical protein